MANNTTSSSKVKVCVRCRPLLPQEIHSKQCIIVEGDSKLTIAEKVFHFDYIFNTNTHQEDVYNISVSHLIEGSFKGFNGTIFAYGQTGSGKTYSMVGTSLNRNDDDRGMGVIPRALYHLFDQASVKEKEGAVVNFRVSFVEIYNEDFKDLLHPDIPSREIVIREDKEGRIFFTGARDEPVNSVNQALVYLEKGNLSRTTAETLMNATSSRSHGIYTISTEIFVPSTDIAFLSNEIDKAQPMSVGGEYIQSKLHIVDLAGSERAKRTGAGGVRLKESVGINQGLLALGKVIRALTPSSTSVTANALSHIPYRESKLTRFLQDSLGGNSRTVMLACVSPAEINLHETLNTLQYASRARSVQNKILANITVAPVMVVDPAVNDIESNIIGVLRAQLQKMSSEISDLRSNQITNGGETPHRKPSIFTNYLVAQFETIYEYFSSFHRDIEGELIKIGKLSDYGAAGNLVIMCVKTAERYRENLETFRILTSKMKHGVNSNDFQLSLNDLPFKYNKSDEVSRLEQELRECREDLQRDEEIFADKVKELKTCRKLMRQIEKERDDLKSLVDELRQSKNMNLNEAEGKDDMELSIAVAANEPDISQLMEDLETISKEKDRLVQEREMFEKKYLDAMQTAQQQKSSFEILQSEMQRRLDQLEDQINSKQDQILDLKESYRRSTVEAESEQRLLILDLEEEKALLKEQLDQLSLSTKHSAKEIFEEKQRRIMYEQQLAEVQDELERLKVSANGGRHSSSARNSRPTTSQSIAESKNPSDDAHVPRSRTSYEMTLKRDDEGKESSSELSYLRSEYQKLSNQLYHQQTDQQRQSEELLSQLEQYKSHNIVVSEQIKSLEDKNNRLRKRLERWAEERGFPVGQSLSLSASLRSNVSMSRLAKSPTRKTPTSKLSPSRPDREAFRDINSLIERYVKLKLIFLEIVKLQAKIIECGEDKYELNAELQPYLDDKLQKEQSIKHQLKELKRKLKSILAEIKEIRATSGTTTSSGIPLNTLLRDAKSYQEHYDELAKRLELGVVSESVSTRISELQDELDAVCTEEQVHRNALELECNNLKKLLNHGEVSDETWDYVLSTSVEVARIYPSGNHENVIESEAFDNFIREYIVKELDEHSIDNSSVQAEIILASINARLVQKHEHANLIRCQADLASKQEEVDRLIAAFTKHKVETSQRQEHARQEAEEKIEYLLQQLRQAETRVNNLSSSQSRGRPGTGMRSMSPARVGSVTRSSERSIPDTQLTLTPLRGQNINSAQESSDARGVQEEVLRRWQVEKERRELLEKRTSELARELRLLKSKHS